MHLSRTPFSWLISICEMTSVICLLMRLPHSVSFSLLPQGMNTDLPYSQPNSPFQNGPMFSATLLLPTRSLTESSTIATSSKLPVILTVLRAEISSIIPMINSSYNKVVVFSVPLQGQYATL